MSVGLRPSLLVSPLFLVNCSGSGNDPEDDLPCFVSPGSPFPLLENVTAVDADPPLMCEGSARVFLQEEAVSEETAEAAAAVPECLEGSSVGCRRLFCGR